MKIIPALAAVFLVLLAQAFYAVKLNHDFYRVHAPFYDSCSYANELAAINSVARSDGFSAGVKAGLGGTVVLPWLEMAALAQVITPSRSIGVWLQWVWLVGLALSLAWYFIRYRHADPWLAACLSLPFVSFARVYDWSGGLPDFRMDLSLYIFLSLTAIWYLATYETVSSALWLVSGVAAMLACLARATAPVYLAVMLGPLIFVRLWLAGPVKRKVLLLNCLWMATPIAIALSVFQIRNRGALYHYYIVLGGDANSRLPWRQSVMHLILGPAHIGVVTAICSLAVLAVNCRAGRWKSILHVDWKLLWLALAPVLLLLSVGAGLNPFVSMPSVFGFLAFAYLPFPGTLTIPTRGRGRAGVCALLVAASLVNVATAKQPQLFTGRNTTRMDGVKDLIERMRLDSSHRQLQTVRYVIPEIGDFHSCAVSNALIYDYGGVPHAAGIQVRSGQTYSFPQEAAFTVSDAGRWSRDIPGRGDEEKLAALFSMAMQESDYLLLPTAETLRFLERSRAYNYINLKTRELKRRLLMTSRWVQLGDPVVISPDESIELYTRVGGTTVADRPKNAKLITPQR